MFLKKQANGDTFLCVSMRHRDEKPLFRDTQHERTHPTQPAATFLTEPLVLTQL